MDSKTNYKHKSDKYKNKYFDLLQNQYQLIHRTSSFDSLVSILQSKTIKFGSNVDRKYRFLSGKDNPMPHIWMNINFSDLKNMEPIFPYSLIMNPRILYENGAKYHIGWGVKQGPTIKPQDPKFDHKINKIKDLIITRKHLPPIYSKASAFMQHELIFDREIQLTKDNLIGVKVGKCTPEQLKILKLLIQQLNTKLIH